MTQQCDYLEAHYDHHGEAYEVLCLKGQDCCDGCHHYSVTVSGDIGTSALASTYVSDSKIPF